MSVMKRIDIFLKYIVKKEDNTEVYLMYSGNMSHSSTAMFMDWVTAEDMRSCEKDAPKNMLIEIKSEEGKSIVSTHCAICGESETHIFLLNAERGKRLARTLRQHRGWRGSPSHKKHLSKWYRYTNVQEADADFKKEKLSSNLPEYVKKTLNTDNPITMDTAYESYK